MSWPEDALTADESVVTAFRPHWKLLAMPVLWFILLSVGWGFVVYFLDIFPWGLLVALGLAMWLIVEPFIVWWTSRYVLTTERLMSRRGLISKSGIEIPLENITNVNFSQTVFERLIGAGDLLVESAGTSGQSRYRDIPHPDDFQTELYRVREERSLHLSGSRPSAQERGGTANAEAIRSLAELRDQGHITDEEYEAKRKQLLEDM